MKILVAGKNGQVGQSLVSILEQQEEVTFLALGREELDITDISQVSKCVSSFKPDVIINAAAYTAVDNAENEIEAAFLVNRDGARNLAIAADEHDAAILHISTDYVFAGDSSGLYTELDTESPQNVYGRSKQAGEQQVRESCERHIILRTAWVFSEYGNNFVKTMLRLAQSKKSLGIVADQFGGPTYAGDIAHALLSVAHSIYNRKAKFGVYHFSGFPYVSWHEFAQVIFQRALERGIISTPITLTQLTTEEYPTLASRPANSKLNCQKIFEQFAISQSDWRLQLQQIEKYQ
ncbi:MULTISPECIES: dTDP-4-dehydrorhamnose reductase [Pseudoalteromonas]|uniref:dTDP-4-dehydrorhamnose reductase n=1 Tax=Pseudoalteromonas TaxID=53246 RepID=UPI001EFED9C1|nr:dTDP-4-dehydrorhamnose reductase [Pseudoalteromonas sp. Isolate6]MCG9761180.1 dTDP-4-dehydrorhamnose reductase [Pseudoalteromonas sp. Isolate6]